jgi:ATP-dependent Clp protease ATP-binding subunit ClpB
VKKKLKPELLSRINDVMVFNDLSDSDLKRIISSELSEVKEKLKKNKTNIKFNKKTIDCLFREIKDSKLHARQIKNYIRKKIHIPISKIIVQNSKKSEIHIKNIDNNIHIC